jgi:hypothetical protein
MSGAVLDPQVSLPAIGFGNLVDLARLQVGAPSAEICDACNTINLGSARFCRCCSNKLAALDASPEESTGGVGLWDALLQSRLLGLTDRASLMDFGAFSVVIYLLIVVTANIPIP